MQIQVTANGLELTQEAHKVLRAAPQPIDRPGGNHVDLPRCGVLQQPVEGRSLVSAFRAADPGILIEPDDFPSRASANRLQLAPLVLGRLAVRRNAKIDPNPSCHVAPLQIRCRILAQSYTESKCVAYSLSLLEFLSQINVARSLFSRGFSVWVTPRRESEPASPRGLGYRRLHCFLHSFVWATHVCTHGVDSEPTRGHWCRHP